MKHVKAEDAFALGDFREAAATLNTMWNNLYVDNAVKKDGSSALAKQSVRILSLDLERYRLFMRMISPQPVSIPTFSTTSGVLYTNGAEVLLRSVTCKRFVEMANG